MKMNRLRSFLLVFLCLCLLLPLAGCGKKEAYPMRPSTEEEARTVFTLGEDAVPFEVLRAFYLTRRDALGEAAADTPMEDILEAVIPKICEVYALFSLCRSYGIDPYEDEIQKKLDEYIRINVEGGAHNGIVFPGFSSYDAYLADLRGMYMNDATGRLMLRFSLCEDALRESFGKKYSYTREDVTAFFNGADCVHINRLCRLETGRPAEEDLHAMEEAERLLAAATDYTRVRNIIVQYSFPIIDEKEEYDFYIGRATWDPAHFSELTAAAFSLQPGQFSDIINLGSDGMYILYKMEKEADYLSREYQVIEDLYLWDRLYEGIAQRAAELEAGIAFEGGTYAGLSTADFDGFGEE